MPPRTKDGAKCKVWPFSFLHQCRCLWAAKQPRLVQVIFSAATLVLSASVAYQTSYFLLGRSAADSPAPFVILAGGLYLPLNTALIAAVVGLVDGRPVTQVARSCYECVFPYFMGGIVFAALVSGAFSRSTMWKGAIVLVPVVVLGYVYSMNRTTAAAPAAMQLAPIEDEEFLEVGSWRARLTVVRPLRALRQQWRKSSEKSR